MSEDVEAPEVEREEEPTEPAPLVVIPGPRYGKTLAQRVRERRRSR